ncbi:hypothetical protein ACTXT7_000211 [Hymenolepis weldensis]
MLETHWYQLKQNLIIHDENGYFSNYNITDFPPIELYAAFQLWTAIGVADPRAQISGMILGMTDTKKETKSPTS